MLRIVVSPVLLIGTNGCKKALTRPVVHPTRVVADTNSANSNSSSFRNNTTHFLIAAGPILPGTDTYAIADVTPQHDKRFEFPDGTFALTAEPGFY